MPMERRMVRRAVPFSAVISIPSSVIEPDVGSTNLLMHLKRVLLPAPEEPMIAVMPLPSICRSSSLRTRSPDPYRLESLTISRFIWRYESARIDRAGGVLEGDAEPRTSHV